MKVKVFFYHVSNIIAVFPDIQLSSAQHVSFGFLQPSMPPRVPPAMQSSRDVMPFTENRLTPPWFAIDTIIIIQAYIVPMSSPHRNFLSFMSLPPVMPPANADSTYISMTNRSMIPDEQLNLYTTNADISNSNRLVASATPQDIIMYENFFTITNSFLFHVSGREHC